MSRWVVENVSATDCSSVETRAWDCLKNALNNEVFVWWGCDSELEGKVTENKQIC